MLSCKTTLIAAAALLAGACTGTTQGRALVDAPSASRSSAPPCSVASAHRVDLRGSAGCLIQLEERLLVVRHVRSGKLTIPGGTSEAAESAQCTAHRETWEEAGVAVEVGPLLATLNNGFHLFECAMDERERARWSRTVQAGTACQRPAEVSRVMLVPAADLNAENYRFPRYLGDVKLAVAALPATQGAGAIASALR